MKLIALDLDGTLFNNQSQISRENIKAIKEATAAGINVVISTGRPFGGLPFEAIKGTGIRYAITANGSAIYEIDTQKCLYENCLSDETAFSIIDYLMTKRVHMDAFINGCGYSPYKCLADVMDSNEFTTENFYMPLLDAGKLKGKQYILPLCFSVPTLTSAESVLKDSGFDMQAASKSLVATMDELLRIYKEKPMLVVMDFSMTSALSQPIIDYKNHTINLDTVSCRQTLAYEKEFRTGEISYEMQNGLFDSFNPEVVQDYFANGEPFASLDPSYMTVGLLRQCAALGIETVTLPIPNELGGVTAEIGSYAIGNRNTKHPAEVKALLAYLLSEECQSSSAFADKDMFPVRRGCLKKCMEAQYQFSVYDASHEKIGQEDIEKRKEMYGDNLTDAQLDQLETICDKINAAQYHTIWYRALQLDQSEDGGNLLSETMVQYWNDEITLDELVDRLTPRLKLYLDE